MALRSRNNLAREYERDRAIDEKTRPSNTGPWDDSQPQDNRARRVADYCAAGFEVEYDKQIAAEYARDEAALVAKEQAALEDRVAAAAAHRVKSIARVVESSVRAKRADSLAVREKFVQRMRARDLRGLTKLKLKAAAARHDRELKKRTVVEAEEHNAKCADMTAAWRNWTPHGFSADGLVVGATNAANEHAPTIAEKLEADLWDPSPSARAAALGALVSLRRDVALLYTPHVVERLVDQDWTVRALAVEGLVMLELPHDARVAPRAAPTGDVDAAAKRWNPNRWMLGPLKLEERMKARARRNFGPRAGSRPGPMDRGALGDAAEKVEVEGKEAEKVGESESGTTKYWLVDLLARRVEDESQRVRIAALRALQTIAQRSPTLTTSELDGAAAPSAALSISQRHGAVIARGLADDELSVQLAALTLLVDLGPAAHSPFAPEIILRLSSPIGSVSAGAVEALESIARQQQRFSDSSAMWASDYHALVADEFDSPLWSVRRAALRLLLFFSQCKGGHHDEEKEEKEEEEEEDILADSLHDDDEKEGGVEIDIQGGEVEVEACDADDAVAEKKAGGNRDKGDGDRGEDTAAVTSEAESRSRSSGAMNSPGPELCRFATRVVALLDDGDYRVRIAAAETIRDAGRSAGPAFAPLIATRLRVKAGRIVADELRVRNLRYSGGGGEEDSSARRKFVAPTPASEWRGTVADLEMLVALGRPTALRYADEIAPLLKHDVYEVRTATHDVLRVAGPSVSTRYAPDIARAVANPPAPAFEGDNPRLLKYPFG